MNIRKLLVKLLTPKENEEELDIESEYVVGWPSQGNPQEVRPMAITLKDQIEAFKKLHFDLYDKIATQDEVAEFEVMARMAHQTTEELEPAIGFMAAAIFQQSTDWDGEETVPDYVVQFGKALLFEYLTGSLKMIQDEVLCEEEEDESDEEE